MTLARTLYPTLGLVASSSPKPSGTGYNYGESLASLYSASQQPGGVRAKFSSAGSGAAYGASVGSVFGPYGVLFGAALGAALGILLKAANRPTKADREAAQKLVNDYVRAAPNLQGRELSPDQLHSLYYALSYVYEQPGGPAAALEKLWANWMKEAEKLARRSIENPVGALIPARTWLTSVAACPPPCTDDQQPYRVRNPGPDAYLLAEDFIDQYLGWHPDLTVPRPSSRKPLLIEYARNTLDYWLDLLGVPFSPTALAMYKPPPPVNATPSSPGSSVPSSAPAPSARLARISSTATTRLTAAQLAAEIKKLETLIRADRTAGIAENPLERARLEALRAQQRVGVGKAAPLKPVAAAAPMIVYQLPTFTPPPPLSAMASSSDIRAAIEAVTANFLSSPAADGRSWSDRANVSAEKSLEYLRSQGVSVDGQTVYNIASARVFADRDHNYLMYAGVGALALAILGGFSQ